MDPLQLLLGVNIITLLTIITFGYKVIRFFNRIEFRVELMWQDYERRMSAKSEGVAL